MTAHVGQHRLPRADDQTDVVLWRYADGCTIWRPSQRSSVFVYCPPGETPDFNVDPDTLPLNEHPKQVFA